MRVLLLLFISIELVAQCTTFNPATPINNSVFTMSANITTNEGNLRGIGSGTTHFIQIDQTVSPAPDFSPVRYRLWQLDDNGDREELLTNAFLKRQTALSDPSVVIYETGAVAYQTFVNACTGLNAMTFLAGGQSGNLVQFNKRTFSESLNATFWDGQATADGWESAAKAYELCFNDECITLSRMIDAVGTWPYIQQTSVQPRYGYAWRQSGLWTPRLISPVSNDGGIPLQIQFWGEYFNSSSDIYTYSMSDNFNQTAASDVTWTFDNGMTSRFIYSGGNTVSLSRDIPGNNCISNYFPGSYFRAAFEENFANELFFGWEIRVLPQPQSISYTLTYNGITVNPTTISFGSVEYGICRHQVPHVLEIGRWYDGVLTADHLGTTTTYEFQYSIDYIY